MITVLRLTFANMKQKKFRSILIILSSMLSVALMYTVLSLSNSTTKIFGQKIKKEVGNAEMMILPKENSGEQYIPELDFEKVEGLEYQISLISTFGYSEIADEMVPIAFTGMTEVDYDTIYGLEFISKTSDNLSDNQVFIGKETAEVYKLAIGEELVVTIGGTANTFTIAGIIEDRNNNLSYDLGRLELIAAKNTLIKILGINNQVNGYFIKGIPETDQAMIRADLEATFSELQVKDVTDLADYKQMITMMVSSLFMMVSAVVIVSAFIIYSSFKVIAIDRMPLMGTLRSIGATRKMTVRTLLFEAFFYGFSGGVLGNALGILILSVTMKLMFKNFGMTVEDISFFNTNYILIALFIGLILAVGSAVAPIIKTSKRSIRSIIFSEIQNEKHTSLYKTMIGMVMVIVAFVIFRIAPVKQEMAFDGVGMLLVIIGGAMVIPMLSNLLTKILGLILKPIYKDSLSIVTTNIKNDRTMMNNIMLLAMGLGVILMINNFSSTVGSVVTDVYGTGKADALVFADLEDSFVEIVREVQGVEHVYTVKEIRNVTANDGEISLMALAGIDGLGYSEYAWDEFGKFLTNDLMKKFKSERSILLTRFTARKYDLSVGDLLEIDFNGKPISYEVIAIVPSIMNNGNETFVYDKFLVEDSGVKNSQTMYINIKDSFDTKEVLQEIKELMPYGILPIQTLKEMQDQNVKSNNGLFFLMKAISIIAMFIGVIGILNNFTISFLSRRKLIATMRSLGLSKKKTVQTMLLEAFFCGLLGTLSGLLLGTFLIEAMCYMVEAMGIPGDIMFYSMKEYIFVFASGIVLSLTSAILPALSIVRENIVSGLRYE
ncbi:MAG: ABC transporter permease [Mobilitalea sp.]